MGDVQPGSRTFGKYQLIRELGRGGMGIVYEALDTVLGRKVAIKTLIVSPRTKPEDARVDEERFLREAKVAAGLSKHPNIVGVFEVGVINGLRYLAMELIEGAPLSEWRDTVPLKQQITVLRDTALAIHHAHERDVIHRDLKPPNILIDARNQPHITDFGLAKMIGENLSVSLTSEGMVVGTPAYISPEQAQGLKTTDARTDIYALGVILYEMMTGRAPFEGQSAMEILVKAIKNPVRSPSTMMKWGMNPAQLQGLETICLKALAKRPEDRYRDAASFASDLSRWLKGEEVKTVVRTRRSIRGVKRPVWIYFAAGAAVLGVIGFLALRPSRPTEPEGKAREKLRAFQEKMAADTRLAEGRAKAAEAKLKALEAQALPAITIRNPQALRPGVIGQYFSGTNFEIPSVARIDPAAALDRKAGPAWNDGPADFITIRWHGYFRVPETGPYVFESSAGDGARLFVDDVEIFSHWTPRPPTVDTAMQFLVKGLHRFVAEYFQEAGPSSVSLACRRGPEPGAPLLDPSAFLHDPAEFTPISRKPLWEHIDWESVPGAQEGETLKVLENSGVEPFSIPFGRNKGLLVWGKNTRPGQRLRLEFAGTSKPRATLILSLGRAKNLGIFRISVNGVVVAPALDLYHPHNHALETEFKNVDLKAGPNALEFTIVGGNPSAKEWNAGEGVHKLTLDYVRVR